MYLYADVITNCGYGRGLFLLRVVQRAGRAFNTAFRSRLRPLFLPVGRWWLVFSQVAGRGGLIEHFAGPGRRLGPWSVDHVFDLHVENAREEKPEDGYDRHTNADGC